MCCGSGTTAGMKRGKKRGYRRLSNLRHPLLSSRRDWLQRTCPDRSGQRPGTLPLPSLGTGFMVITFSCTGCGRTIRVSDSLAGRKAKCPQCQSVLSIPEGPAGTGDPPPTAARRNPSKAKSQLARSNLDRGWTAAMERALRAFQPRCLICGTSEDLTNQHVRPVSRGHGLRPGNAVRLCRSCNSFIHNREASELTPDMAAKLESGAAAFKAHWAGGCVTPQDPSTSLAVETPKAPDPALTALLRAVECGENAAVLALATWLEERSDPRAAAVREVARLEIVLGDTRTRRNGARHWISFNFRLDGKLCGPVGGIGLISPIDTEEALAQLRRETLRRQQSEQVWQRLGLSLSQSRALKEYLGLSPQGVAASVEEMAQRAGNRVQTIRNRINLALCRLAHPAANPPGQTLPR